MHYITQQCTSSESFGLFWFEEIGKKVRRSQPDLASFLADLPDGLDTVVGEKGVILSGGQKQMISIARTLLKQPDILIFDEATSNIDKINESFLNDLISNDFAGKTCIIISHRKSCLKSVEKYFVIDHGWKVQEGS
ncbi:ATP-binding cassette domain-containing protein [candidate division KSB1 bacterium]